MSILEKLRAARAATESENGTGPSRIERPQLPAVPQFEAQPTLTKVASLTEDEIKTERAYFASLTPQAKFMYLSKLMAMAKKECGC